MRAILLREGGVVDVIDHDGTLEQLQATVGGYVQAVDLPSGDGLTLWMNEDGKAQGQRANVLATAIARHYKAGLAPDDVIVGPVLVLVTNEDGDTEGLSEQDANDVLEVAAMLDAIAMVKRQVTSA